MSPIKAWAEIQQRANKLGCLLLKSDFCFNVVPSLIQFVANWQRFSTSHLSSILASSPRVYLSCRHDASFPLRAIADTEAQTNKCAHMDPHMVYVHSRAYRASLFAERVLLTSKDTHTRLLNSNASTCKGGSWEQRAGRKDGASYITNAPGLTLIPQHFNAARLIPQLALFHHLNCSKLLNILVPSAASVVCLQRTHTHARLSAVPLCVCVMCSGLCNIKHHFFDPLGEATINSQYRRTRALRRCHLRRNNYSGTNARLAHASGKMMAAFQVNTGIASV